MNTKDGESINGLFFRGIGPDVILYFHGNAGDLSGWQHITEDFTVLGYNVLVIDYRGFGKSSGEISEKGFYLDSEAAYDFLLAKDFPARNIIIYGRSIGSGVAVDLASRKKCKGLVLESPFSDLAALANDKFPFFFPSLYVRYKFDNIKKMDQVKSPVLFLHGTDDTLIPPSHSKKLFDRFHGKKEMILIEKGGHNDLNTFTQFEEFLSDRLRHFF